MARRRAVDIGGYVTRVRADPCFVCQIVRGEATLPNPIVYEDDNTIAWVNPYQVLLGYTIVAPKDHREQVTGDFTLADYLELQRVLYRIGEAVRRAVPTERLYVLSLGSQQGNRHVHWHVARCRPASATRSSSWRRSASSAACSISTTMSWSSSRHAFGWSLSHLKSL